VDLAIGHLKALDKLSREQIGVQAFNLGTGRGYSVLEMIHALEQASGRTVKYRVVERRPGDVASCYADPSFAAQALGWRAVQDVAAMARDAWRWQSQNPQGFGK
jgi:UDP-glucose 4-epimerase